MSGNELVKLTQAKLGGFANVATPQTVLGHLNEAKDEIWKILKSLDDQHFVGYTQSTDTSAASYFPVLSPTQREYPLPSDFREIKLIEVIGPWYRGDDVTFVFRKMTHPDFVQARRAANVDGVAILASRYVYTITGDDPQQLVLAQWPETAFTLRLWYVHSLPDITLPDTINEIVSPYDRKMADYAAKRILLANDLQRFEAWRNEWREDVIGIAEEAGPRNQADPQFVPDFEG